jgi:hypothetical protein
MKRLLFTGSLLCIIFLLIGTFAFPDSMIMELASMSLATTIFRGIMAAVIITVLFTLPPRRMFVRLAMGSAAVSLLVSGLILCFSNSMHLLDVLLFLELGCSLGIEALELNDDEIVRDTERLQELYKASV